MGNVITISRQYGSGGRELGERLSERLGIPLYDKELINLIAKKENIEVSLLESYDEMKPDLDNYTVRNIMPEYQISMAKKVYAAYSRTILALGEKEPCVIVGRCADVILPDSVRVFVHADPDYRLARVKAREELSESEARKLIRKMDNRRRDYRKFYCELDWGTITDYDLSLNIGKIGMDGALETVLSYVKHAK